MKPASRTHSTRLTGMFFLEEFVLQGMFRKFMDIIISSLYSLTFERVKVYRKTVQKLAYTKWCPSGLLILSFPNGFPGR
ncbi:hypothetical protein T265_02437 [Opisthorchis viverrini]|uniref:Uncharacterized protein n=1 Tax=Opisthorchis viverrini TaxID=6198 RepID=A0A075AI95_OPIVI|nr:hypothetical protein T265_02437 [Opisthorchis viverrini]KER31244.1 hypothetical protein T265_02437 [Opisthorchis viverrini]